MNSFSQHTDPASLDREVDQCLRRIRHPILVENHVASMDLAASEWRLEVEYGKLIFTAWNSSKSISRRIESFAYRDRDRFGVFVRAPGGRDVTTLEFREFAAAPAETRSEVRTSYRQQLLSWLKQEYRGWKFQHVSNGSDREHSFSGWYMRGLAVQGTSAWAFLGLGEDETPAAADNALAFGLIWLDWLRNRCSRLAITHLKLFLPPSAVNLTAHRSAHLNTRALHVEIFAWNTAQNSVVPVDGRDYGNTETHLSHRRQIELLKEEHLKYLAALLKGDVEGMAVIPDAQNSRSSLRIAGLEIGVIEGQLAPRTYFGLEGSFRRLDDWNLQEFGDFIHEVRRVRRAGSPDRQHDFYRLQSERWLESLLFEDITRIDPALSPEYVYSQVPAFSGVDRGIIDLLTITRGGRLAVVELKVQEHINLPLQGLDYWIRVNWLQARKQFRECGYFQGRELAAAPPLLYLVSPSFRFHSTTKSLLRYFDGKIETILIGINDNWREGVRVLFRHFP